MRRPSSKRQPIGARSLARRASVVGAVLGLLAVGSSPASAADSDSGSKSCQKYMELKTRAYSTGTTTHTAGGESTVFYNGNQWKVSYVQHGGAGAWKVTTTGHLDSAGTYGYCTVTQY